MEKGKGDFNKRFKRISEKIKEIAEIEEDREYSNQNNEVIKEITMIYKGKKYKVVIVINVFNGLWRYFIKEV